MAEMNATGGLPNSTDTEEEDTDTGALSVLGDTSVRKAMKKRSLIADERKKYYDDLALKTRERREGPSFSERMYQLSSAFFAPTTTRGFSGVAGNVLPVLAAQQKAQREGEIKREDALSALAAAQLAQREALAEQELETEIELAKINRPKPTKVVGNTVIAGVPSVIMQDADGNITTKPLAGESVSGGVPAGKTETRGGVVGYYDESGVWKPLPSRPVQETFRAATPEEAAMYGAQTGQISNLTGKFLPGTAPKPRTLSGSEQKLLVQSEDVLASAEDTLGKLRRVIELNPRALEGSLTGFRKQVGSLFASDDPTYVATEELDNTLSSMALSMLKSTFPGSVTEGERKALMALQGSSSLPRAARERIYRNAFEAAQTVSARARDRIQKTQSGFYSERTSPAKPAAAGKVIRYDKTGKRI
jgi:hypothetical protein